VLSVVVAYPSEIEKLPRLLVVVQDLGALCRAQAIHNGIMLAFAIDYASK
jgi:hypothetical protein